MLNLDTLYFVICYTVLLGIVAAIYFSIGYKRGIKDTLLSMRAHEPTAVDNALKKMQDNIDAKFD